MSITNILPPTVLNTSQERAFSALGACTLMVSNLFTAGMAYDEYTMSSDGTYKNQYEIEGSFYFALTDLFFLTITQMCYSANHNCPLLHQKVIAPIDRLKLYANLHMIPMISYLACKISQKHYSLIIV